jgi:glycosyltransferase involved in cell wall biosynthesis
MPAPLVSVVICTHNRPGRLAALLDSLRDQALADDAFEVIVVDEASGPDTTRLLIERANARGPAIRSVRQDPPRGPSAARNTGWRMARAPLIAFTDDDCRASPGWLSAGLAAHERNPGTIIQGRTEPDPKELGNAGVLSRTVRVERLGPHYETCNVFYPRSLLEGLGGFDEGFGLWPAAEDTDLAWRAIELGHGTAFANDALVLHAVQRLGVLGMLRVATRWTAATRVLAEHPQTRTMLYRGVFWNVWHYLLWRSLLALGGPSWLRRLVLTRHLLELRKRARNEGGGSWAIPFFVVHDLVECWAVARGATRYRTPVL